MRVEAFERGKGTRDLLVFSYAFAMAGKYDSQLKLLLFACAGFAVLGLLLGALGEDAGSFLVMGALAVATAPLFPFAMQRPLKDKEKKADEDKPSN